MGALRVENTTMKPCMIHGYEPIVLRTIAGPFRGYRCASCGHVTDVDPRKSTHHVVYPAKITDTKTTE